MNKFKWSVLLIAVLLLLVGCAQTQEISTDVPVVPSATPMVTTPAPDALTDAAADGQPLSYYTNLQPEICKPFVLEDWTCCGFGHRATEEDVVGVLGEPNSSEMIEWAADGSVYEYQYYDFGWMAYQEGLLEMVGITSPGYPGPRDISVGDSLEDAIREFCTSYEKADEDSVIFYRENEGRENDDALPPCGVLSVYDNKYLSYTWIDVEEYEGQEIEELEGYIPYMVSYTFYMEFDEKDIMTAYYLTYGASAE